MRFSARGRALGAVAAALLSLSLVGCGEYSPVDRADTVPRSDGDGDSSPNRVESEHSSVPEEE